MVGEEAEAEEVAAVEEVEEAMASEIKKELLACEVDMMTEIETETMETETTIKKEDLSIAMDPSEVEVDETKMKEVLTGSLPGAKETKTKMIKEARRKILGHQNSTLRQ